MNIVIAGGTASRSPSRQRSPPPATPPCCCREARAQPRGYRTVQWTPDGTAGAWASAIDGAGAVVNLAGESIAAHRWNLAHKQRVLESRVTRPSLVAAIARANNAPPVFVSGSAVGYYGLLDDRQVTEESPAGRIFSRRYANGGKPRLDRQRSARTRVVCVRTGLVLARDGGALRECCRRSVRNRRPDWIRQAVLALDPSSGLYRPRGVSRSTSPSINGPLNATAPQPPTNKAFAKAARTRDATDQARCPRRALRIETDAR
jgi:NAD dependent epimerase/dehydratase family enzyme